MASRFYFPSSGASPINPAFGSGWTQTGSASRFPLDFDRSRNTGTNTSTLGGGTDQALEKFLRAQWVSPLLKAQTISSQSIKAQFQGLETLAQNDLFLYIGIRLVDGVTGAHKSDILTVTVDDLELFPSAVNVCENRSFTATTTSQDAVDGDRLVIEVGHGGTNQVGGSHNGAIRIGVDSGGSDLAENNTDQTGSNVDPWLEFPNDIVFLGSIQKTLRYYISTNKMRFNNLPPRMFAPRRAR